MLNSFYQNSLALDYLRLYALKDPIVSEQIEIKVLVYPPKVNDKEILHAVFSLEPHIVGFSAYLWNINKSLTIAQKIKDESPRTKIIIGGVEVSYNPRRILTNNLFVDAVITGEGEIPFRLLLSNYLSGKPFGMNIPGIWLRKDVDIISGGLNQCVQTLDEIPSPFLSEDFDPTKLTDDVLYETYRGCVFKCSYCLYHRHAGNPRFYSLERVKKDLSVILSSPCKHIRIVDSTFNIDKKRTKEILQFLKGTDKKISVEMSAEFFDEEMVDLCSQAGIRHIDIGLQSATDKVLKAVNRAWHRKSQFRKNMHLITNHPEITLNMELICGLPKETLKSFKKAIDKAVEYKPDHISIYRLLVLDGSDIRKNADKYGIEYESIPPYSIIKTADMSKEDFSKLELLMFSNIVLYNTGIARLALRAAMKKYKVTPSQIYEMFTDYCLRKSLYSEEEIRRIANHYAVGNRFDRPLPKILSLDYLKDACCRFFFALSKQYDDIHFRPIFDELVDYGYNMASLDNIEREMRQYLPERISDINKPSLSRFSFLKTYSPDFFQTLRIIGFKLSKSKPFGIAFFIHKTFGPIALALSKDLFKFLSLCNGKHDIEEIVDIMGAKSDLQDNSKRYESAIRTLSILHSDFQSIGLLI